MIATRKPYIGFQAKVLVPVITVMVLLLVMTISIVNRRIASQLESQAKEQLRLAAQTFNHARRIRDDSLLLQYRNLANEPRAKAIFFPNNPKTVKDFCEKLNHELGVDGVLLTSVKMNHVAASSRSNSIPIDDFENSSRWSVARALQGEENVDTAIIGRGLFQIVSIPVSVDEGDIDRNIAGALTFAVRIDNAVADEFKRMAHCDVVFLAGNRVLVSTAHKNDFNWQFVELYKNFAAKPTPERSEETIVKDLMLGQDHALRTIGSWPAFNDELRIGYLLLTSYEEPLRELEETRQLLLMVTLAGILLSALIILIIVRKVSSPLRQLQTSAEALARGDFSHRVPVESRDECGQLAAAINQMIDSLKTSREELEKTVETLKTAQAQLIQREKLSAIGEFVAGVAHELNNPLTSVIGFSQLLHQSSTDPHQQRFLDRIVGESQRCAKIVTSLLSFARQHPPERKLVDINHTIEAAVDILRYQLRTSGIEVGTKFDPRLPNVMGDTHQLQQVFVNIINNARQAIEAHRPNGKLSIITEYSDGVARVLFEDNGPGIARENLNKIFNPFFTTKEIGKGTGLGLSLSYGIVQEHGGSIAARNNKTSGATFIIELPVAQNPNPGADTEFIPAQSAPAEADAKYLLVVDDEDAILELTREVLTSDNYCVEVARDGYSALRKIGQRNYDLVVCDMKMPDLNGQQVYERLHATNPAIAARLIFMTGDVINEKAQQFFKHNGKVCLAKPFTLDQFRDAVNKTFAND